MTSREIRRAAKVLRKEAQTLVNSYGFREPDVRGLQWEDEQAHYDHDEMIDLARKLAALAKSMTARPHDLDGRG